VTKQALQARTIKIYQEADE